MTTNQRAFLIGLSAYFLAAIITFGHAAAAAERAEVAAYQWCRQTEKVCLRGIPGMNGFLAGIMWPLYWSWEAFSNDQ